MSNLDNIAKVVFAEAGIMKNNYPAHLAVAQCVRDIYETKELGNITLEQVLERAFNGDSEIYDSESLQATKDVFKNHIERFPGYRILQFRSFTKYSNGNGFPNSEKLQALYDNYEYLGKDSISDEWGHFYFGRKKTMRIMLDPGHYGSYYNQSPAVPEYYESNVMWKYHLMLKSALERRGVTVGTTRKSKDENPGLVARGMMAKGYDLFLSLHSNAVGSRVDEYIDYPVAFVMMQDGNEATTYDKISYDLGLKLAQTVGAVMGSKQPARAVTRNMGTDRDGDGIIDADDEYYGVVYGARQVKVPGIIIEHSFHTNTAMTKWLLNDNNLQRMAEAEADTICNYFGVNQSNYQIINGTLRVSYGGSDGVNLREMPNFNSKIVGVLNYNDVRRAVGLVSLADGNMMYRLEDGEYITAGGNYVQYTTNGYKTWVGQVKGADGVLNVRNFPSSPENGGKVVDRLGNGNRVDIIGEANNHGTKWYMVKISRSTGPVTGFVSAKYIVKA